MEGEGLHDLPSLSRHRHQAVLWLGYGVLRAPVPYWGPNLLALWVTKTRLGTQLWSALIDPLAAVEFKCVLEATTATNPRHPSPTVPENMGFK